LTADEAAEQARSAAPGGRPERAKGEKSGKSAKGKGQGKGKDSKKPKEKKGVLLEETPNLDTYESRKRVRLLVGLSAVGVLGLSVVVLVRGLGSSEPEPADEPQQQVLMPPMVRPDRAEAESAQWLSDASSFASAGREAQAEERLNRILTKFPRTAAADSAREALDRRAQGLPYFLNGPAVLAERPEPIAAEPETPTEVVEVAAPRATSAEASLHLADQAPEPRRETGLVMEQAEVAAHPLPEGFQARPEAGVHPTGWPLEITSHRDGSTLVLIPGGTFPMGRDGGNGADSPAHQVTLSPYYIDQHEVTNRQYALFQQANGVEIGPTDQRPVVQVSYPEAVAFLTWTGKRLPTEAQWEMAGRTTDGRTYPWGNASPSWELPREPRQIDPVMSFGSDLSPYGVFDLAGNAWEWTADDFSPSYYRQLQTSVAVNPTGPSRPGSRPRQRTVRGASSDWLITYRIGVPEATRYPYLGFRGVLNVNAGVPVSTPAPAAEPPAGSGEPDRKLLVPF
jgi:formylglycine-generating enzyme required for sulfatase activity